MTAQPVPQLQPLSIGQLLDRAIRLYRRNFLTFIGIIALVQVPLSVLQLVVSLITVNSAVQVLDSGAAPTNPLAVFTPGYFAGLALGLVVALASLILVSGVGSAAMTRAVADNYLGQPVSILGSYRRIGRAWGPLVGTLILASLAYIGLALWLLVPCVGWLTGLGILVFFSMVIVPLLIPIVVLEKRGGAYALRRAWDLARRRFWWVLGFAFILTLFAYLIVAGPSALVSLVFQALIFDPARTGAAGTLVIVQTIIQSLLQLIFSLIYVPLQLAGMTLLYFDLRVRTEGFDLALLAQAAATEPTARPEATAQAPLPERTGLVTINEMAYFSGLTVGLTVGAGALYFIVLAFFTALGVALGALMAGGAR